MTLFQAYGLKCNGCGKQFHTVCGHIDALEIEARRDGWFVGIRVFNVALCPDCDGGAA